MDKEALKPLAEYLATASIAYRLGIGLTYAHQRYVRGAKHIGEKWYELAEMVNSPEFLCGGAQSETAPPRDSSGGRPS